MAPEDRESAPGQRERVGRFDVLRSSPGRLSLRARAPSEKRVGVWMVVVVGALYPLLCAATTWSGSSFLTIVVAAFGAMAFMSVAANDLRRISGAGIFGTTERTFELSGGGGGTGTYRETAASPSALLVDGRRARGAVKDVQVVTEEEPRAAPMHRVYVVLDDEVVTLDVTGNARVASRLAELVRDAGGLATGVALPPVPSVTESPLLTVFVYVEIAVAIVAAIGIGSIVSKTIAPRMAPEIGGIAALAVVTLIVLEHAFGLAIRRAMRARVRESLASSSTRVRSMALGLFNLLPFPFLDGGRILFVALEAISGRKPNRTTEALVHAAGMLLLLGLAAAITWRDIVGS